MKYLDGFKPARSILVVVDNGLVLTDSFTTSTFADHVLRHKRHTSTHADLNLRTGNILSLLLQLLVILVTFITLTQVMNLLTTHHYHLHLR